MELSLIQLPPRERQGGFVRNDLDSQIVGGTENTANNPLAKIKKFDLLLAGAGSPCLLQTDYRFADDLRFQASYAYYASDATDPNSTGTVVSNISFMPRWIGE